MILYHGSTEIVENPIYGYGSVHNDYGLGFYCTENQELAKEWACQSGVDGFLNKYELDLEGLRILYLNGVEYHILNWMALLLENRSFAKRSILARQASEYMLQNFLPDISEYDVVIGYRADDSYFSYAKDFLNNVISVGQLSGALKLGGLGEQVVLISQKSFSKIRFCEYEIAEGGIYFAKSQQREKRAREAYLNNHGMDFDVNDVDLYVRDVLREQVKNDDPRIR